MYRQNTRLLLLGIVVVMLLSPLVALGETVRLYAAGSLKNALGEVAQAFEESYGIHVTGTFGPSGLLAKEIAGGEEADLFASANMKHPATLVAAGWGRPVVLFARNTLCALAQPEVKVTSATLLEMLLDERIRLGTSTPKADPSGDYAWELFAKAEGIRPGSEKVLTTKALQLTGGPKSQAAPDGRNPYVWNMEEKKADVFLTYCTNGVSVQKQLPSLQLITIPQELAVGADYGLVVRNDAPLATWQLAMFILSPTGQEILKKYGFEVSGVSS
ncbi:MAG: molybdate ABC transporter substrate-binding protein [Desulfopila sp.]